MKTSLGINVSCKIIKKEVAIDLSRKDPVSGFSSRALLTVRQAKVLAEILLAKADMIEREEYGVYP